jgi:hypothetical protein
MPDDLVFVTPRITIRQFDTFYWGHVRGSVRSTQYRHLWADVDGKRVDLVRGGDIACAYYVSSLLYRFDLVVAPHATVVSLIRDMVEQSGWVRRAPDYENRLLGAVVEWEPQLDQHTGETHGHVGFCTGPYTAISHCSAPKRYPDEHDTIGHPYRALAAVYTHPFLLG